MTGNVVALSARREVTAALHRAVIDADAQTRPSEVYRGTGGDDPGFVLSAGPERFRPSPAVVDEAKRMRSVALGWLAPVPSDLLRDWLLSVNSFVANPQDELGFEAFYDAAWITLGQYPARCFTDETLTAAQIEFAFFPSVHAIVALIEPLADDLRKRVEAIIRLGNVRFDAMGPRQAFPYGPAELSECIETWNRSAERTGLDPIEPDQVAAGNELPLIIARHGLAGWRRALDAIEGSPWLRSKRPTFNWLAASEPRFARTILATRHDTP
jgi:hypothetical protein